MLKYYFTDNNGALIMRKWHSKMEGNWHDKVNFFNCKIQWNDEWCFTYVSFPLENFENIFGVIVVVAVVEHSYRIFDRIIIIIRLTDADINYTLFFFRKWILNIKFCMEWFRRHILGSACDENGKDYSSMKYSCSIIVKFMFLPSSFFFVFFFGFQGSTIAVYQLWCVNAIKLAWHIFDSYEREREMKRQ